VKIAVVLFNLGGPDSLEAVEPFLRNLFSDRAILPLPGFLRRPLARLIAARRAPVAREIYAKIAGRSPILEETEAQARALEAALEGRGHQARAFIVMRAWKPFAAEAVAAISAWAPDRIVLAPLYPQFSTVTTQSALEDWRAAAADHFSGIQTSRLCCYPTQQGFVTAEAELIRAVFAEAKPGVDYRLLLSAHGLPERTVAKGDPYRWQVEKTAQAIVDGLGITPLDWSICYQSRVGPLKWIGPATDAEIRRAGADGKGVVIAPIAFVSEHSETLVELDLDYAALAFEAGVPDYRRVPTVRIQPDFIAGLAGLIVRAVQGEAVVTCVGGRICPAGFRGCGFGASHV
jgi:ferrochelatase